MTKTCLIAIALTGAASVASAQKKEDIILSELRQIRALLAELQTSQAALEAAMKTLQAQADERESAERKTIADSRLTLESIQRDLSVLSERVDETNSRLGNLGQEIASIRASQQPLVVPPVDVGSGEAGAGEVEAAEESPPPAVAAAVPSITDIYNQARIDYTQGRYPLAISGFKEVLELDRSGELADNAHYWTGECYLNQNQFERAIEAFDTIIRKYPDSNKLPDAYLKKAMTLEQMNRMSEALTNYELVISQFPRSPQERVARRRLEALMRTTIPRPQ
ncbi:MAG TPA: tol-pal system protein YbgF [Vicinamibacteria bacterium]|nr:tol-pal system protein YbgF [Vicinamibacteria bacterium]